MLIICNNKGRKGVGLLVDHDPLKLIKVYECTWFGHVLLSKTCQYVINDKNIFNVLLQVSVKDAQSILQKTITWTNKYGKKLALNVGCHFEIKNPIKTKFSSKVIMFQKTMEFKQSIITCYGREKIVTLKKKF